MPDFDFESRESLLNSVGIEVIELCTRQMEVESARIGPNPVGSAP